ncbi:OmcA/MtrC family decaheme c-type cytochrome [Nevskia soli]|uniref:OmcA/MtrC family decaheme c-type cytochrome n=1 Tax=Nevskia soli TaxID=418856 RepID=UPI0015D75655|nr:OmcA/MtrC family decaheme c-type cytochrome [Nevskia soli]
MKRLARPVRIALFAAVVALCLTGQTRRYHYGPRDKGFYLDQATLDFVSPGLVITINSAQISSAGAITVTYSLADPNGLPLDATGATTPGVISLAYVASYIPNGQEQYVAYTTSSVTGAVLGTITRPDFELGSPATQVAPGQYTYTFQAVAPAGFDPTVTTTVAVDGNRDLTPFNLPISYAGTTFNFVPNGGVVTVTRDVIRTASCNTCHDQLAFHGGYANGMEMCVLCHQPQNADPVTGNSLDLKVMAHAIHMGSQLPSVVGTATTPGVPYQIAGYMGSLTDFSTVIDPANPQRCGVCHSQTTGAAQATAFLTEPTRAACGACHNNVNFATGANHPGGFQTDDTQCADCHIPQGETPFDASILGAHVVPGDTPAAYPLNPDTLISSVVVNITGVTNTNAGQNPTVAFTLNDINGNPLALSALSALQFTMAGPTTDYGYTSFGSDVTTPGYVGEDGTQGTCDGSGNCTYTFMHAIPAGATGSYAIGAEAVRQENVLPNTNAAQTVETGSPNPVVYFSVDGSAVAPRRTVVGESNCNQCHVDLVLHGNRRNNPQYCVMCHNPSDTDFSEIPAGVTPQTINMAVMVHRIHDGVNVVPAGGSPYIIYGYGGSINNFSGILYPAMSTAGDAPYLQNCSLCHTNGSEQNLPVGLNAVVDPQGWINPIQPTSSACSGCHVSKAESSHFLANTNSLGESCTVCHAAGAEFAVDAVHAQ